MRVFQVNADWNSGGPGSVGKNIEDVLIANGHECFVAYGREDYSNSKNSFRIDSTCEVYTHAFLSRITDKEGTYSTHATKRLIEKIISCNPDIIQLHNLLGHYLNYPLLFTFLRQNNIPTVWTLHDCWAYTGHCINYERIGCQKWKSECFNCPLKTDYPYSIMCDRSRKNYREKSALFSDMNNLHIIVPSKWLAGEVSQSFLQNLDINVFYNGIDLSRFYPHKTHLRDEYNLHGKKILLSVAYKWNEMKGYGLLCEMAKKIPQDYAMVVIGNKDEKKLPNNVISLPVTSNFESLIRWYSEADVFVNPTLGDNFPTVNIEALSCGTPVVTCNTGGSPEVAGNEFGRVVYSKTADEFIEKIQECLDEQYTAEACHAFAQRFEMKKCYQKYIELYVELLAEKGACSKT